MLRFSEGSDMGKPAARLGDMTIHGGSIVVGAPTVMIGGAPAARIGDNHVCPMMNPGTPPPPHVGGPIIGPGAPTVLIGGMPAACVGDSVTCAGPPDTIAPPGCPTVMIGTSPGSGGGAGAGGGSGQITEAEARAAAAAEPGEVEEAEEEPDHYLNVKFIDKGGNPITGVSYTIEDPDGNTSQGKLAGYVKATGITEGSHKISLKAITSARWSAKAARDGETVQMIVETAGIEAGKKVIIELFEKDYNKSGTSLAKFEDLTISGDKVEADWAYEWGDDDDDNEINEDAKSQSYSRPQFYFTVQVDDCSARSGILDYKDWIEFELNDDEGNPMANEPYRVFLPNGEVREGQVDNKGYAKIDKVSPGKWDVEFKESGLLHESDDED